jgi:TRAP-type uncharacterized transport system substrate-binding protein
MSFAGKQLVFGGGVRGSQWATLGEIAQRALAPHGYAVRVDENGSVERNPRLVASGEADLGATNPTAVRGAFSGTGSYTGEEPRRNLRAIATVRQGNWEGFAARAELGIKDLGDIAERRLPVRVIGGDGHTQLKVWSHYGLSPELIESWGGKFYGHPHPNDPAMEQLIRSGEFDMIVTPISAGYAPDSWHWHYASLMYDLRFLPLPESVIGAVCDAMPGGEIGFIPHHLYRGVEIDTPAVCRPWRVIITSAEAPDELANAAAEALHTQQRLFRQTHLSLEYDVSYAPRDQGIPLHRGAERYYRTLRL